MELGEKIRSRRAELGLTQAALCGETVTRNMLSQIEGGKASPSLATLRFLAERLEVPIGYFFCDEEDEFFYKKQTCFPRLRELFTAGSYAECLRVFEKELGYCDDELGLMMAICAFECGKKAWRSCSGLPGSSMKKVRILTRKTREIHISCSEITVMQTR